MSTIPRKSVAILFLGGATIDERQRLGETVTKPTHVKPWLRAMSEMDIIAETEGFFVVSGQSSVGLADWIAAGQIIKEQYQNYDGFVVVHQLETLPAGATALSLMLQSLGKPVVLCGSPLLSAAEKKSGRASVKTSLDYGAKASFINAVQVAVSDIAGVVIVYGSHMYLGSTVVGSKAGLHGEVLGKIDFGIRFFGQQPLRSNRPLKLQPKFETKVAVAEYMPGVDLRYLLHLPRGTRAIFLSSPEGAGAIDQAVGLLRGTLTTRIPIVTYSGSNEPTKSGTLRVGGSSRSTALLRLMWALGQTDDLKKLEKLLV